MARQFINSVPRVSLLALAGIALFLSTVSGPAMARSCPADLSALDAQIQTPSLRTGLTKPLDDVIQSAGGVEAAISEAKARLDQLNERQAAIPASAPAVAVRPLNEAITIIEAEIAALECRRTL